MPPSPQNSDLDTRLLASVSALMQLFLVDPRRFPSGEGRVRYNSLDFAVLGFLEASPGARATDMVARFGVPPTTLQSVIDRLVRRGLVDRMPHPQSGRARALSLTEAGADLRAAIHRQDLANMRAMLDALDADERETFAALGEKIAARLAQPDQDQD